MTIDVFSDYDSFDINEVLETDAYYDPALDISDEEFLADIDDFVELDDTETD